MFITAIEDAFLTRLNTRFSPTPVIIDYGGGPEPTGDYGVLGITTANKIHRDSHHFYDSGTTFDEKIKQDYEVVLTVKFYGDTCYDNAFEAQGYLQQRNTQEDFHYNDDISIIDVTNVRRIPELRDTGYVQKASFDINLLIGFEQVQADVDYFDTVEFSGTFQNELNNVVFQFVETPISYLGVLSVDNWKAGSDGLYTTANVTFPTYLG